MKKICFALFTILMLNMPAVMAETYQIKVSALSEFKTEAPSETINVNIQGDTSLGKYSLHEGDTLKCNVLSVTDPKRGKQSASFYVQPTSYVSNGQIHNINDEFYGKYSKTVLSKEELKKIPPGKVIKKTALTVGSHFVKGLSAGVYFAAGVIKNEDDNRLKSGIKNAYKESPLSYVEKGQELDLKEGDIFYLVFKITEKDEPNYSYTESANN